MEKGVKSKEHDFVCDQKKLNFYTSEVSCNKFNFEVDQIRTRQFKRVFDIEFYDVGNGNK